MIMVRIVGRDSKQRHARSQDVIPYLGRIVQVRDWNRIIVGPQRALENLHHARASGFQNLIMVESPFPARVIDARYASRVQDGIDVGLHHHRHVSSVNGFNISTDPNRAQVEGDILAVSAERYLPAGNHQQARRFVLSSQIFEDGQMVVVGQHEEIVSVVVVPLDDLLRLGIAVRLGRVGMDVAPVRDLVSNQ